MDRLPHKAIITTNLYDREIVRQSGLVDVVLALKDWASETGYTIHWIGNGFFFGEIKVGNDVIGRFHIHPA